MVAIFLSCTDFVARSGFVHWLLIFLLILYTLFGGWLFRTIEGHRDEKQIEEEYKNKLAKHDEYMEHYRLLEEVIIKDYVIVNSNETFIKAAIRYFLALKNETMPGPKKGETPWTFMGAMFYSSTIYTTIGYGNFAPQTTGGRVATMLYAIFGLPLVITILGDWGAILFVWTKKLWNFIIGLLRKMNQGCCGGKIKFLKDMQMDKIRDEDGAIDMALVPISLALFLLFFWILVCAAMYCIWEEWDYFESIYFFFISLTTIGLGDYTPKSVAYAIFTFVFVLIGLAVVGLSINVIQAKVEALFESLQKTIEDIYKNNMDDDVEEGRMGGTETEGASGKDGVKGLETEQKSSLGNKMLVGMMGNKRKQQLEKQWEQKSKLCAKFCQTDFETHRFKCQVGKSYIDDLKEEWSREDDYERRKARRISNHQMRSRTLSVGSVKTIQVESQKDSDDRFSNPFYSEKDGSENFEAYETASDGGLDTHRSRKSLKERKHSYDEAGLERAATAPPPEAPRRSKRRIKKKKKPNPNYKYITY